MKQVLIENNFEDTDRRPNRYSATACLAFVILFVIILILNEFGVFRVDKTVARIALGSAIVLGIIPWALLKFEFFQKSKATKFIVFGVVLAITGILTGTLSFHAYLALFFPIILATQYPSRSMTIFAFIGSAILAFITPFIGYLINTWDYSFLLYLVQITGGTAQPWNGATYTADPANVGKVILYISFPNTILVLALGIILVSCNQLLRRSFHGKGEMERLSRTDILTGIQNRLAFEEYIDTFSRTKESSITIVYMDANGLHEINNEGGHLAGDAMLKSIALGIKEAFDEDHCFRVGGDEFVVILFDAKTSEVKEKLAAMKEKWLEHDYHVAVGIATIGFPCDLRQLSQRAEENMFADKSAFYSQAAYERRKSRQ